MSRLCACADEFLVLLMSLEWRGVIVHVRANVRPNEQKLAWFGRIMPRSMIGVKRRLKYSKVINSGQLKLNVFAVTTDVFGCDSNSEKQMRKI